jgi:predicted RNA-binding Zn-ribbon protein involved in translation (DUF1610 family)
MAETLSLFTRIEVQRLLRALIDGKISVIEPKFDIGHGFSYPVVVDVTGASDEVLEPILNELSSLDILTSTVVDNIAVCPTCGSYKLMMQMRCPKCGMPNLQRGTMIEHLTCGHLDMEENFGEGELLTCPKCGKSLRAIGVDYRRLSMMYRCLSCKGISPDPRKHYICENGHSFDEEDLVIKEIRSYRFNPAKRGLIEKELVDFKPIVDRFKKIWNYKTPAILIGQTGAEHEFSFAMWEKGKTDGRRPEIVANLSTNEKAVGVTDVLAFQAKAADVGAREKILMVMPKLDEKGKLLASSYGIQVSEAKTASELQEKTIEILKQTATKRDKKTLESEAKKLEKLLEEIRK